MGWYKKLMFIIIFFIFANNHAYAENVIINEIMYDFVGADSGHEWVEIYNNGIDDIDLSGWKFYEAGTNHNLNIINGSFILESNDYAIIADNADTFLSDNPGFIDLNKTIFDTSFSLSNSGEYLALYNGSEIVDEVNYSSDWGGGNGYSLELIDFNMDNNNNSNWNSSLLINGTPGQQNGVVSSCEPNLVNTTWTNWFNQTGCLLNDTYLKNRSRVQYDEENCNLISNTTFWDYQYFQCDYCLPVWVAANTSCQEEDSIVQWYSDSNSCFSQTNLSSDLEEKPSNMTYDFSCDYNLDGLIGNVSDINTTISNLSLEKNNTVILLKEGNNSIIEFDLKNDTISLAEIYVEKQANDSLAAYLLIRGLNLQNVTKIIYLENLDPSVNTICIDDSEIDNIDEISSGCNEVDEILIVCDGSDNNGYSCEEIDNGTRYKIIGLSHSGVIEQAAKVVQAVSDNNFISRSSGGGGNLVVSVEDDNQTVTDNEAVIEIKSEQKKHSENKGNSEIKKTSLVEKEVKISLKEGNIFGDLLTARFMTKNTRSSRKKDYKPFVAIMTIMTMLISYSGRIIYKKKRLKKL